MKREDLRELELALRPEMPAGTAERLAMSWLKKMRAAGSPWAKKYEPQFDEPRDLLAPDAWLTPYRDLLHASWELCTKHWDRDREQVHVVRVLGDLTDWATLRESPAIGSRDGDGKGLRDELRRVRDQAFAEVVPDTAIAKPKKRKPCKRRKTFDEQLGAAIGVAGAHARAKYGRELTGAELAEIRAFVVGDRAEDKREAAGSMSDARALDRDGELEASAGDEDAPRGSSTAMGRALGYRFRGKRQ